MQNRRFSDSSNERREYEYIGFTEQLTSVSGYSSVFGSGNMTENVFRGSISGGRSSSVGGGTFHGTLKMGYLHSGFSPVSGQELHMKYDESSTDDDPVMYVEGKDIRGKSFIQKNPSERRRCRTCHASRNDSIACPSGAAGR